MFHLADKVIIIVYFAANIGICLLFRNVERLWIFITAILICTALVPVMAAFYWPRVKRRAGQAAALTGFGLVAMYYHLTGLLGVWDEAEYVYIWSGRILGWEVTLNQDYGILIILPVVIVCHRHVPGGPTPAGRQTPMMLAYRIWTWIAITLLAFGSTAVFVVFLVTTFKRLRGNRN